MSRTLLGEFLGQKDFLPAVTDEETFNRIQTILRNNRHFGLGRGANLPNIFKGVCKCAICNHVMNVQTQRKNGVLYRYLVCSAQRGKSPCTNKRAMRLDDIELEFFNGYMRKEPDALVDNAERQELKELRTTKAKLETDIATITTRIQTLLDNNLDMPEIGATLAKLNKQRMKLNAEMDDANAQIATLADAPTVRAGVREILVQVLEMGDDGEWKVKENHLEPTSDANIKEALADSDIRNKMRLAMPALIGKMTVNGNAGVFKIYNRAGKLVYETARPYVSNRNRSERWLTSLGEWTTRNGKPVNRK